MKPKLILPVLFLAALTFSSSPTRAGDPRVFFGFQSGWTSPYLCTPIAFGRLHCLSPSAPLIFWSWGSDPGFENLTVSRGFRTISPVFHLHSEPAIIRVPPPVLTAPTIPVEPSTPFRWRR